MEKIREIYKGVIEQSQYMREIDLILDRETENLLHGYKDRCTQQEYEVYRGVVYELLAAAKEEAFIAGFRYAVQLVLESSGQKTIFSGAGEVK